MNGKVVTGLFAGGLIVGIFWYIQMGQWNAPAPAEAESQQLVYVGDTLDRVDELLGAPSIEFPKSGSIVRWYAGYEIALSNGVVTAVKIRPIESEEERKEKELRARLAEERLRTAYDAMAQSEKVSYDAWLQSEEKRLEEERAKRAKLEAYNRRKSEEKKAKIYADALKDCGCHYGHYCSRCR